MAADFYYNDYAFRNNSIKGIGYERKKIFEKAQKIKLKRNIRCLTAVSMLMLMFVILIYLYGQLMEVNYSLNYNRSRMNSLSVKIDEQRASNSSLITAAQIREYAENSLGMREPSKNQIRYLTMTRNDTTLLCAPSNQESDKFEYLLSIFK